ncbi:DNA polymerase III subunit beta [Citricoccus sp.]|uniref:DNA polymerase III subunit beta n=1 Tax=Citricoccus sp. TaxID=1978372 RepID=UPI0026054FE9|nr:DNA polymerase III subunit beta [Citricoccus sp.]HRO30379.1 DNA polymerase III subunit beta [Citricoccus sp.]HRO92445.1 DNA polymerase III subunit beta [Citricoccus sp.]
MKFTVERDILTDAVSWTARSLSPRPPVPVLSGLLITAEDGLVSIASFDYETSAQLEIEADIETPGKILVSGRLLNDIVRSLPAAPVTVETEGSKVIVTCRNSRFDLATMPVEEYPALPELPESAGTVDGTAFAHAVAQVTVAASRDDTLPILTAVKLEIEGDRITFLATDRYRLALKELTWSPADPSISTSLLVKSRTLTEVAKSLAGGGDLELRLPKESSTSDLVGFSSGGRRTTSVLVDGEYPKIRALFPESSPIHAVVATGPLVEAVNRVKLVAERNTAVRMVFTDGQVALDAGTGNDASANESLDAALEGDEITVAFNPSYLGEGLNVIDAPYVRFSFTTAPKPALMTAQQEPDAPEQDDYRYLVMPVRLTH